MIPIFLDNCSIRRHRFISYHFIVLYSYHFIVHANLKTILDQLMEHTHIPETPTSPSKRPQYTATACARSPSGSYTGNHTGNLPVTQEHCYFTNIT